MYQGEVDVAKEDCPSFLEVAEDLNVKGLCKKILITFSQIKKNLHNTHIGMTNQPEKGEDLLKMKGQ